jgi:hypothetical protein
MLATNPDSYRDGLRHEFHKLSQILLHKFPKLNLIVCELYVSA